MMPTRRKLSVSTQVVLALLLGALVGLCFGEHIAFLQQVGKAFILLLQMTVLPYIVLSLMTGLGNLTYQQVKTLAVRVGTLLVISWGLAFLVILLMPLAFPSWVSASFFSTSLIEKQEEINLLTLFIPSNPFFSLSNNFVPAVVIFSVAVGVALIGIENKQALLVNLDTLNRAMGRITQFMARLTPFGVFAVVASAAGTMSFEELARLQVFLVLYMLMAVLLTFWLFPVLITTLTPLTYRQVVGATRDVLITAFATGSALIVLPLLIERSHELLRQSALSTPETERTVEVIIPAFTSFPKSGTLFPMSFVLFAGWFAGTPVAVAHYPMFLSLGLVSFFGSVNVALPLLLNTLRIPSDLFQLFLATTVVTSRFSVLLTTMNNLTLSLLGACAVAGLLTMRWGRLLRNGVITLVLLALSVWGARAFFAYTVETTYRKGEIIAGMQLLRFPGPATVYTSAPPAASLPEAQASRLEWIQTHKLLRVGYMPDNLPFAYFNAKGDLVGFDIEMAHLLARDLGVQLAFVPVMRDRMTEQVNDGYCDIVMSGTVVTPERAQVVSFSAPYMDATLAFIVKDHRLEEFSSRDTIRHLKAPRIGVLNVPYYVNKVQQFLPQATIVQLNSIIEFFEGKGEELDAFLYSAEAGSAWSLLYPAYTVAIPQPGVLKGPVAYPLPRSDRELVDFINVWLELKKRDRTIETLYDYWILGKNAVPRQPHWSVIRNVLHWVP
jgi:Na+/H+-dicarboxylate symporter/ABC-type amino acid transport substrate-binding protein